MEEARGWPAILRYLTRGPKLICAVLIFFGVFAGKSIDPIISNKTWQAHKKSAAARTQQAKLTQKTNYFAKNWLTSSNKELGRLLAGWFPAVDYVEHARS